MSNVNLIANVQYTPSLGANPVNVSVGTSNITYQSVHSGTIEIPADSPSGSNFIMPSESLLIGENPGMSSQSLLIILKNRNASDIGLIVNKTTSDGYSLFQLSAGGVAMFVNPINTLDDKNSLISVAVTLIDAQPGTSGYVDYWAFSAATTISI